MDIHNELKAMMDINLKPEFELAINEVIEKSYKADIEKLGPGMAGLVKCQWEKMKPYLFFAYCLGAKAQAVPDTYTPIVLALESVQSKIAKTSFLTMDEENENEVMAVDANDLAAYIDKLIEAQEPAND